MKKVEIKVQVERNVCQHPGGGHMGVKMVGVLSPGRISKGKSADCALKMRVKRADQMIFCRVKSADINN